MKIMYRFFPDQSPALDKIIAQKILELDRFKATTLETPFLYRGDMREPSEIFNTGFIRKGIENEFYNPSINEYLCSDGCISATTELVYAIGFADHPMGMDFSEKLQRGCSFVYLFHTKDGFQLFKESSAAGINMAKMVNEVVVTGVPPEAILAALKIKVTKNQISDYINGHINGLQKSPPERVQWQIPILDCIINDRCTLKETEPKLYERTMSEFLEHSYRAYFNIPWAPIPETGNRETLKV